MINLYMLSKTPSSCLCFQLSVSVTVPRVKKTFFRLIWTFFFSTDKIETIEWQDLVPRQRTDDCLWIHILVEDFGIRRYQVTKVFPTWWSFASVPSAKSPCYFWFVGILSPLLQEVPSLIPENCVWVRRQLFHQMFFELRQPVKNMGQRIVPSRRSFFYFGFGFSGFPAPVSWWLVRHFAPILNLKTNSKNESCDCDLENELLPELADHPGTTRGTKLSVLQMILFPFGVNRGIWPLTHSKECPWSSQSLPCDWTAGSPFAENTTVGVMDLFIAPISSELNSFLLIMCIDAPESTTTSHSSGLLEVVGAGIPLTSPGI